MDAPVFTQDNLLFTVHSPLGKDKLLFKNLQGEEQLSGLFHFRLELLSKSRGIDFQAILGKSLTVQIQFAPEHTRYLHGIVTRFAQADTDSRFTTYYADIRPWLWQLTLTQNCRIFQNLSVPDIIKKVFTDLDFHDYRFSLVRPDYYEPRIYCVQYQETAFNFVSRLMEDVGIFYFFEHHEDRHVLVIIDDMSGHPPCPEIDTARFWRNRNETHPEDVITQCQWQQQLTTGQYAIDDFNFELPQADLKSSIAALPEQKSTDLRVYEYDAGFSKFDQGQEKVTRRIESQVTEHKLLEGQGHCFSFVSGYQFTLTEHPREDFNIKYVLRWISHSLSLTYYQNSFIAFPADLRFRTPRTTPRPQIVSSQTAIVTGPAGDEIYTDQYGRIKVQFHWDQEGKYDENSSCWIRVNQGWAGKSWGHIAIPRIGQEVIVSFLNGNPDTPLVTGAVYNASQTVPYPLPAGQTKSTLKSNSSKGGGGYNEICIGDKKGDERVSIRAEKRLDIIARSSFHESSGGNREARVGGGDVLLVGSDQDVSVGGGNYELLGNSLNQTIKGNIVHDWQQNVATIVGQKSELNAEQVIIEASQQISLKVGGNFVVIDPAGVYINGSLINLNSGGAATPTGDQIIDEPFEAESAKTCHEQVGGSGRGGGGRIRRRRTVYSKHAPMPVSSVYGAGVGVDIDYFALAETDGVLLGIFVKKETPCSQEKKPIYKAKVEITSSNNEVYQQLFTNKDGLAQFEGIPKDSYKVVVTAENSDAEKFDVNTTTRQVSKNNPSCEILMTKNWDSTMIPGIMRKKSDIAGADDWKVGAKLMEYWFSRGPYNLPKEEEVDLDDPSNGIPYNDSIVTVDWALSYTRAESVYKVFVFDPNNPKDIRVKELIETRLKANPAKYFNHEQQQRFGDLSQPVAVVNTEYLRERIVTNDWIDQCFDLKCLDGMVAALGQFAFRMAAEGTVTYKGTLFTKVVGVTIKTEDVYTIQITKIGIYIRDRYDFTGWQLGGLGCWNLNGNVKISPPDKNPNNYHCVDNSTFRTWRDNNGCGGDFIVFSNIEISQPRDVSWDIKIWV